MPILAKKHLSEALGLSSRRPHSDDPPPNYRGEPLAVTIFDAFLKINDQLVGSHSLDTFAIKSVPFGRVDESFHINRFRFDDFSELRR